MWKRDMARTGKRKRSVEENERYVLICKPGV